MAEAMLLSSTCHPNLSVVYSENRYAVPVFSKRSVNYSSEVSYPSLKSSESNSRVGASSNAVIGIGIDLAKGEKWWEKEMKANMKEVSGAQDLVDSLKNAGDKLVVVNFFSPGCGGCKSLHPKISQLAEMNVDVEFLQVNHEEHKSMCYSLNVPVLPFFSFYRGVEGGLCNFSCTNATIKKFKDALAKYGPDRSSLGPTKGLEEKKLIALAANLDLSFTYSPEVSPALVPLPLSKVMHA